MSSKEKKAKIIESLQETFAKSTVGVLTDYRGLTTAQITALRRKLRETGINYKVVKNTLAGFAAERAGKDALPTAFEGPVAIAFGFGDITAPAKILAAYIADTKLGLNIKGGFLGNKLLTAKEVTALAMLPPREVLLGRVIGQIQMPLYVLLNQLNAPLRGFMTILQARIKQLEGE